MKVRAKHGVFYRGAFYPAGKEFDVQLADTQELLQYCEPVVSAAAPNTDEDGDPPEKKRSRPRKES